VTEYEQDPRPDLWRDHAYWVAILTLAMAEGSEEGSKEGGGEPGGGGPGAMYQSQDVYGILHGLRCGGASLVADKEFGLVLQPGGWEAGEYAAVKARDLAPRRAQLVNLLQAAAAKAATLPASDRATRATQAMSLKESIRARVQAVEPRLLATGWTNQQIWSETDFRAEDGHMTESVFGALLAWPEAEIGEVTEELVEFKRRVGNSETMNRLRKRDPALGKAKRAAGMGMEAV
jgi:hypothetical protein